MSDTLWNTIRQEVAIVIVDEPALRSYLRKQVLQWRNWHQGLAHALARRLSDTSSDMAWCHALVARPLWNDDALCGAAAEDLQAVLQRDPACTHVHVPFLFHKGFHALQLHRAAHWYWQAGLRTVAYFIQHRCNEALGIDIHPAVPLGRGVMLDHGTGFVAGETAVIGNDVNLLHGVTLGGTGKQRGDRHPKVRDGASIGAGAKILGNIEIGAGARIGAGAVVLQSVPPGHTAVGFPARLVSPTAASSSDPVAEIDPGELCLNP